MHRQRERQELRESLSRESEQIARDCERVELAMTSGIEWNEQFAERLLKSSREHQPIDQVPPNSAKDFDVPDDPVYLAAKASNKLELLTPQEVQAYGELDALLESAHIAYRHRTEAHDSEAKTVAALPLSNPSLPAGADIIYRRLMAQNNVILAAASLDELYRAEISAQVSSAAFRFWSRQVHGAAIDLKQGDRDLQKIQAAERQFDKLP